MTRLAFLLMAGVCAGQPAKYSGFPSDYQQLASLFGGNSNQNDQYNNGVQDRSYARPLSFGYMSQPMGQVQIANEPSVRANAYSSFQKMAGEQFFKSPAESSGLGSADEDTEEVPYKVIKDYGPYEHREYPSANFACVKAEVDTSDDVFAGLKNVNPLTLMNSKRYKKTPEHIMFMSLFKYISGVNKDSEEIEMTRPVSTLHSAYKAGGEQETQEMCFYIPSKHQENPPQPLDKSPVYIRNRPTMKVYVRQFGGFIMTDSQWKEERDLLDMLLMGKPHHDSEYYSNVYNSPFVLRNRRNEVWIQDLTAGPPVVSAVVAEQEDHMDGKHHKGQADDDDELEPQPEVHVPFDTVAAASPKKAAPAKNNKNKKGGN